MFRIHRDVRFSRNKSPYKTSVGIQFRHKRAKDAHAPGFYLHLEPGNVFAGLGMWHPDSSSLNSIRSALVADPKRWKRILAGKRFSTAFDLAGDSLKRPPHGYDPEHILVEDLKRKDFMGVAKLTQKSATSAGFIKEFAALCRAGTPFMRLLCEAVDVGF